MNRHLGKNASIVHSPDFENALSKMQRSLPYNRLSPAEKKSIEFYIDSGEEERESDNDEDAPPAFASIAAMASGQAEAEQRVKRSRINGQVKPMTHLSPTSNIVEDYSAILNSLWLTSVSHWLLNLATTSTTIFFNIDIQYRQYDSIRIVLIVLVLNSIDTALSIKY